MMPLFVEGALGPRGLISIVPARNTWRDSFALATKVYESLKTVLETNEKDTTTNAEGAFAGVAAPPPDPKAKNAPPPGSSIDECLNMLAAAMEAAEVTSADLAIAVAASGPSHCTITEETPEGAEEGSEEKETVYTYALGEERRTKETVEMYVGLIEKGVHILIDPLHVEDKAGMSELAAAFADKSKDFVVGGDLMYDNSASAISAAAAAAVDPEDGETRPWANCIQLNMCEAGTVSETIAVADAMTKANGKVILQNADPHVAVGLGVGYVRMGTLSGPRVSLHNEFCRIEAQLRAKK